ncbi:MAG: hypothetical protein WAV20_19195 [Blastocatellia bacterium]
MLRQSNTIARLIGWATVTTATVALAFAGTTSTKANVAPGPDLGLIPALAGSQSGCPIIFPAPPVTVAPNQPEVKAQSSVGIINALCDVTLNFIGCGFTPTSIVLGCDTNGDGVSDLSIPLKNITVVNRLLVQATIPSLTATPGTAFPLACCGGMTTITLKKTVGAGDDNVFGPFTQTITCSIDLGIRAPVVISATPVEGDCALGQNLLIPGSCFLLSDGKPNVTSVFAVEAGNPNNVIQANPIHILSSNLLDAFFQPGVSNAGKTFLIFASGPNGTSRNLTVLPAGAPAGCPLGNEQGVPVTFKCKNIGTTGGPGEAPNPSTAFISGCRVERDEAGVFTLSIFGKGIREGAKVTVGGIRPKKIKFRDPDPSDGAYTRMIVKGKFCDGLPGVIVITNTDGSSTAPVLCEERCLNQ